MLQLPQSTPEHSTPHDIQDKKPIQCTKHTTLQEYKSLHCLCQKHTLTTETTACDFKDLVGCQVPAQDEPQGD